MFPNFGWEKLVEVTQNLLKWLTFLWQLFCGHKFSLIQRADGHIILLYEHTFQSSSVLNFKIQNFFRFLEFSSKLSVISLYLIKTTIFLEFLNHLAKLCKSSKAKTEKWCHYIWKRWARSSKGDNAFKKVEGVCQKFGRKD